jgi:O-antigen/teichoic acid export membrane protein
VVYLADQKPSSVKMIETSGSVFSFLIVLILTRVTLNGDLILLGTIISVIPVILFFVVTIVAFKTKYKKLKPTVKDIDFKVSKGILNLGAKFFFMQISFIIVFTTSNFFIAQFYGPEEVTVYNIAFKYFQIPIMIFSIFMSPLWSAVTDAYAKSDFAWLKKTLKYSNILTALFSVGVIFMVLISNWVYKIWIGDKVLIPIGLTVSLGIYTIIDLFITPYSYFINGMGKLRMAVVFTFIEIIVYFMLIFLFGNLFKNSIGIVLSISLTMIMLAIVFSLQTYKLLNNNAKGIWNK